MPPHKFLTLPRPNRDAVLRLALTILFCALAAPALAAPKPVTFAGAGQLLLPDDWSVQNVQILSRAVEEAKGQLGLALDSKSLFYALKRNGQGNEIASLLVEEAEASPLNNNILPLLSPAEQEEMCTSLRLVLSGALNVSGAKIDLTDVLFKDFGRYHTLLASGKQTSGHQPLNMHLVYYFLPERTVLLVITADAEFTQELNRDFTVLMDSFDPDTGYQPVDPPEREAGENLAAYLQRIYGEAQ